MEIADFLEKTSSWAWPIAFVVFALVFAGPIQQLLKAVANTLGKAKSIQAGGITWTASELDGIIIEREKLKAGVIIATAGMVDKQELVRLRDDALGMEQHVAELSEEVRGQILTGAIRLASADNKVSQQEYEAIVKVAQGLELSISIVNAHIKKYADGWKVKVHARLR